MLHSPQGGQTPTPTSEGVVGKMFKEGLTKTSAPGDYSQRHNQVSSPGRGPFARAAKQNFTIARELCRWEFLIAVILSLLYNVHWGWRVNWWWEGRTLVLRVHKSPDHRESARDLVGRVCITQSSWAMSWISAWLHGTSVLWRSERTFDAQRSGPIERSLGAHYSPFPVLLCTQWDFIFQPPLKSHRATPWFSSVEDSDV